MHLLVIGHTAHYRREGQVVGWGPTVREIDWLARVFDRVTHLACFHSGPAPQSALPYAAADKVRLVLVPPAGGFTLGHKARAILNGGRYSRAIIQALSDADVVQVRCPGILGMYGMILVSLLSHSQKWAKYAGNWVETGRIPASFRLQRWWLRAGMLGGPVTINGRWPQQREHLYTFDNPSLTLDAVRQATVRANAKKLEEPIRFVFAGRADRAKGLGVALEIVRQLLEHYPHLSLDVLGDSPERADYEEWCRQEGLSSAVLFHGWVPHERACDFYARSHFMLLPSETEGWPKVLSEAMAYGVVPISSQVSAIPQVLAEAGTGVALPARDIDGYVQAIRAIIDQPSTWREMVKAGLAVAPRFTFERYLVCLDDMLRAFYGSSPLDAEVVQTLRDQFDAPGKAG